MKTKTLLLGCLAIFLTAGCNVDEVSQVNDENAITFKAVVPYVTRAAEATTNSVTEFSVWGYTDTKVFMDGVTVTKNESGVYATYPTYYWPGVSVDFIALCPVVADNENVEIEFDETSGRVEKLDVSIPEDAAEQFDLCYAVTPEKNRGTVSLNFRHALTQVVFAARTGTNAMNVKIAGVKVCSVYDYGIYTIPTESTETNYVSGSDETDINRGSWGLYGFDTMSDYSAGLGITEEGQYIQVPTDYSTAQLTGSDGSLFLIPQEVAAWNVLTDHHLSKVGAYFRVNCQILDEDGEQIWPNAAKTDANGVIPSFADIAIPVDIDWVEGYKYTYTFIFGEGAGYYPPDDTDDPEWDDDSATPVLLPISFDISIDDFENMDSVNVSTEAEGGDIDDGGDDGDGNDGDDDDDDDDGDDTNPDDSVLPYITDAGFKSYVLENFDFDSNGYVSFEEAATVTTIECHTAADFAGIEYFTALESFTSYSVETIDLSKNSELTSIELSAGPNSGNLAAPIVSIDLSGNTKLTAIGDHAFYYCTSLEEITFPSSLVSIGERAFQECTSLKAVTLPDGFTTLGGYAFDSCSSLAEANFPEKLESIGTYAFNGAALTSVVLPASVTSLGTYAFSNSSLVSIDFSKLSLTALPASVCNYCSHLTSVTLPDTLEDLGNMTFYHCSRLETITIPAGVTSVGNQTFRYCSAMLTMYCLPTAPPSLGSNTFGNFSSSCVLYVPAGSVDAYADADAWGSYFVSVEEM